jgi:hypothetical protein
MDLRELIDRYCLAWSEPDATLRADLLGGVWSANATYTDPTVHLVGAAQLLSHITKVQARRPGAKVIRTGDVDFHHDIARFAWHVVEADGSTLPEGLDIAFISSEGSKLERIIGFFGPLGRRHE